MIKGKEDDKVINIRKRGSFATISLRGGCEIKDIAEVLGHKRIETTEKYYILSLEENKKKVTKVFENEMNKI